MSDFRCCMLTPDPGPWTAGVDDSADPQMVHAMHDIREQLSGSISNIGLVSALRSSVGIDNRTRLGRDIQRCLLSIAADRLQILGQHLNPWTWKTTRERFNDAWEVWRGRAVCIRTFGETGRKETP